MRPKLSPKMIEKSIKARLKKLTEIDKPLIAASLVKIERKCGNPNCKCAKGEKHVGHILTFKEKQKTKSVYVPVDRLEEVREWVKENKKVKKLIKEINQLSLTLLKRQGEVKKPQIPKENQEEKEK